VPSGDVLLFDPVAFGAEVRRRRRKKRIPQDRLALAVGISRVQLQNIEHGVSDRAKRTPSNPRLSTVVALCRELEVSVRIDFVHPRGAVVVFEPEEAAE
jgi:transcriptional regulator with XRE-family HTH domain